MYVLENRLSFLPTIMEFYTVVDPDPNTFETGIDRGGCRIYFKNQIAMIRIAA